MVSNTVASNSIVLEVLNQHNYKEWSSRVETYLSAEDLWDVVNMKPPEREEGEAEYKAWRTKDSKALHVIKISCGTELFSLIYETRTSKRAWEVLERQFKSSSTLRSGKTGYQNNSNYDFDSSHSPFFDSLENGDWDAAKESLATVLLPNALRQRNAAHSGCTALHIAARKGHVHIVKELVLLMTQEDLQIIDDNGCTALHLAVIKGHVPIVKELVRLMREEDLEIKDGHGYTALGRGIVLCHERGDEYNEENVIEMIKPMIAKSPKILAIVCSPKNYIPVAEACRLLKFQVCRYLYSVTPLEALMLPNNGSQGASLVSFCLKANEFDIPRDLLSKCPILAGSNCEWSQFSHL